MPEIIPTDADMRAAISLRGQSNILIAGAEAWGVILAAFAAHAQAAKLEGIRIGLEAGAGEADEAGSVPYDDHVVATAKGIAADTSAIDPASLIGAGLERTRPHGLLSMDHAYSAGGGGCAGVPVMAAATSPHLPR